MATTKARLNLEPMNIGEDYEYVLNFANTGGIFDGSVANIQAKYNRNDTTAVIEWLNVPYAGDAFDLGKSAAQTANLPEATLVYDLEITKSDGKKVTPIYGYLQTIKTVTEI